MAVAAIPIGTQLILRLNTGLDEDMKTIYRNRTYSNVKPTATNVNLFELAEEIAYLQIHTMEQVRRSDVNGLEFEVV